MTERVLVAGASGLVGYEVARLLRARGRPVRTLSRSEANAAKLRALTDDVRLADAAAPGALAGACDGVTAVVSCLGAAVSPGARERRRYADVDLAANTQLLAEARRAGVARFVYLSVFAGDAWRDTAYVAAHEAFGARLRDAGIAHAVVRPPGIFGALGEYVALARRGLVPLVGDGASRTNPIHEADVAEALCAALDDASHALDVSLGGPDVLSRRQIAELAFEALGRPPRCLAVPPAFMRAGAALAGLVNPRAGEFLRFVVAVSTNDCVAPARGTRRLADYFRALATAGALPPGERSAT